MDKELKSKEDILKELLLTEEDTLKQLKTLIDKTKAFVKIDEKTKKIVVSSEFNFLNPEKLLLFLIGKYFSKELGITDKEGMDVQELEKESGIKKTTLSKPLGGLLFSGYIGQDEEKKYFVHHYRINDIVNMLHNKFIEKAKNASGIIIRYKTSGKKKGKGEKNG
jgi:hypothetical protein